MAKAWRWSFLTAEPPALLRCLSVGRSVRLPSRPVPSGLEWSWVAKRQQTTTTSSVITTVPCKYKHQHLRIEHNVDTSQRRFLFPWGDHCLRLAGEPSLFNFAPCNNVDTLYWSVLFCYARSSSRVFCSFTINITHKSILLIEINLEGKTAHEGNWLHRLKFRDEVKMHARLFRTI